MRKLLILFLLLPLAKSLGQAENPKLKITHLTGDFYIYTTYNNYKGTPFPANGMYVVTDQGVVLFDTPWDPTQFQPLLDSIDARHSKKVVMCFATHSHEDRTAGLEFYRQKGIKTYTTKQTDDISAAKKRKRAEFLISTDTIFKVGQHTFQTYYGGKGHSPDNIVIWFEAEKILYGGCLIKSTEAENLGNLEDADTKAWPVTLKNILTKFNNPEYIIPGHQDWHSKGSIKYTLQLLELYKQGK